MPHHPFVLKTADRPHLVRGSGGLSGEIGDIRDDVREAFAALESQGGYFRTDEFTNPAVADVDAIKTSIATSASIALYEDTALNGVIGGAEMIPPRNPTITSTANAHVTAVAVVFAGRVRNADGVLVERSVTVTPTGGGGTTDAGNEALSFIDSITVPAMGGTGGSLQFGFGPAIGLSAKIKSRAGLIAPIRQIAVGAVVVTGTFTNPSGAHGSLYTPAAAPDGTRDYAVTYEVDPS